MIRNHCIVCVSTLDWDAPWTSKQQIMHRLAQGNRILYVEEPVTMLAPLKVPSRWRRWAALIPRLRRAEKNLWVLTPPPLLPFGNMRPLVNRVNQTVLGAYIRWALKRLGWRDYLLWTYLPTSIHLLTRLRPRAVVYHCVDEHSAFPGLIDPQTVRAYDDALTRRADLVIATASSLCEERRPLNPRTFHVPNAADVDHFKRAYRESLPEPSDLAPITRPRLGIVGVHNARLDLEALRALSAADPDWRLVLIGPYVRGELSAQEVEVIPRVHSLGGKPREELPAYLRGLDVALIPYRLNELTRHMFPLKLFEYLAAGLPVVAAALPTLEPFRGVVYLAKSPEDYPGLVKRALEEDSSEMREKRVELARENSWDGRVEDISRLVDETLRAARQSGPTIPESRKGRRQ